MYTCNDPNKSGSDVQLPRVQLHPHCIHWRPLTQAPPTLLPHMWRKQFQTTSSNFSSLTLRNGISCHSRPSMSALRCQWDGTKGHAILTTCGGICGCRRLSRRSLWCCFQPARLHLRQLKADFLSNLSTPRICFTLNSSLCKATKHHYEILRFSGNRC